MNRRPPRSTLFPYPTLFRSIIQVERVQPAEVEARHVLLAPVISAAQLALARRLADSVHDALAAGASLDTLARRRSEEHTSELQSRLHLVCRLLLEKKKNMLPRRSAPRTSQPLVFSSRMLPDCD